MRGTLCLCLIALLSQANAGAAKAATCTGCDDIASAACRTELTNECTSDFANTPYCVPCMSAPTGTECAKVVVTFLSTCTNKKTNAARLQDACRDCATDMRSDACEAVLTNACVGNMTLSYCSKCMADPNGPDCENGAIAYLKQCPGFVVKPSTSTTSAVAAVTTTPTSNRAVPATCTACANPSSPDCRTAMMGVCMADFSTVFCKPCMQNQQGQECVQGALDYLSPCSIKTPGADPKSPACSSCADPASAKCSSAMTSVCMADFSISFCALCAADRAGAQCKQSAASYLSSCAKKDTKKDTPVEAATPVQGKGKGGKGKGKGQDKSTGKGKAGKAGKGKAGKAGKAVGKAGKTGKATKVEATTTKVGKAGKTGR